VQPGSLSLVHVGSARAARTRVTVSAIVFVAVVPMRMRLDMWWAMVCGCGCGCCLLLYIGAAHRCGDGSRYARREICALLSEGRNIRVGVLTVSMCRRAASVVVWDGGQGEWARPKDRTVSRPKKRMTGVRYGQRGREWIRKSGGPREVRWRKRRQATGGGRVEEAGVLACE
jgi:hypothetical protein